MNGVKLMELIYRLWRGKRNGTYTAGQIVYAFYNGNLQSHYDGVL